VFTIVNITDGNAFRQRDIFLLPRKRDCEFKMGKIPRRGVGVGRVAAPGVLLVVGHSGGTHGKFLVVDKCGLIRHHPPPPHSK
jgi:hypothetical protein